MHKLSDIAKLIEGRLVGEDLEVSSISVPLKQSEGSICIISTKEMTAYKDGAASAYIMPDLLDIDSDKPVIFVKHIRYAMVKLLNLFMPEEVQPAVISDKADIDDSVSLGQDVSVGAFSSIGRNCVIGDFCRIEKRVTIGSNVKIGNNCRFYPGVVIYDNAVIEDNVTIHANTVIGADGFGYIPGAEHLKIPHKGNVHIHKNVEIGCNTTIDRATLGSTEIGEGSKIDNLVQIGHNVQIGKGCFIISQCGISGSSVLGDYVILAGQVGVADHVHIGDNAVLAAKTGVPSDLEGGISYGGIPAVKAIDWHKQVANLKKLPELRKKVAYIEKMLGDKDA